MTSGEDWGRARLLRGVLRAYDPVEHMAAIEPVGASTALLEGLPVLGCVAPSELEVGRTISMVLWPDVGGVVLGPAVAPYASKRLWDLGVVATESDVALTITYADLVAAERTLPADGVLHVQGVVTVEVTGYQWSNLTKARLVVEGGGQGEVLSRALAENWCETLTTSWVGPLEAGQRGWSLQAKKNGGANTHTALAGAYLLWMVFL
ncbi:MAG: hypothetical protein ACP5G7_06455 [Anaerolineae bacterium]